MQHHLILRVLAKFIIPFIVLYALYVQFHGDFGPGGGFQAGVIVGAGMILYTLIFGLENAARIAPPGFLRVMAAIGILIYAGTGLAALLLGGNYLDYNQFNPHHPAHGQELGIFLVELGVGVGVSATMTLIFFAFSGRGREEHKR